MNTVAFESEHNTVSRSWVMIYFQLYSSENSCFFAPKKIISRKIVFCSEVVVVIKRLHKFSVELSPQRGSRTHYMDKSAASPAQYPYRICSAMEICGMLMLFS